MEGNTRCLFVLELPDKMRLEIAPSGFSKSRSLFMYTSLREDSAHRCAGEEGGSGGLGLLANEGGGVF